MQKVRDAVRYGIETLSISPERMFSLLETSKDYDGDDYPRWLASQIIKTVEAHGVGYSQLLIKRFDIIRDLIEEVEDESSMKESCISMISSMSKSSVTWFSVNMEELGTVIEDVDWFSKIDYSIGVLDFFDTLPEDVKDCVMEEKEFNLNLKLSTKKANKKSDVYLDAKNRNITCKTEGALMLHRLCLLSDALSSLGISMNIMFISDVKFICDKENDEILRSFLEYFTYEGRVVNNRDFLVNSFVGGKKVICYCTSRSIVNGEISCIQDGFVLPYGDVSDSGHFHERITKRYSSSSELMKDYILNMYKPSDLEEVPSVNWSSSNKEKCLGLKKAFGYLCFDRHDDCELTLFPQTDKKCVPITNQNFRDVVVYYGVSSSLGYYGVSRLFTTIPNGHDKYEELFSNCLPLFLYDVGNKVKENKDLPEIRNKFNPDASSFKNVVEKSEVFFSFEAKRLYDLCYGYLSQLGDKCDGKSFEEVRKENQNDDFNSSYLEALVHLKDFVWSLFKGL